MNENKECRCLDVDHLRGPEALAYQKHLEQVASGNWTALLRCPATGQYWRRTFPDSEMHGGGPPLLEKVSRSVGVSEFGLAADAP
jgi:hypothetical protein